MVDPPSYASHGLVNLVAEVESRMIGAAHAPRLDPEIGSEVPEAATYVVVLFDGLGVSQLGHPKAASLRESNRATLDAPFPTTTSVSLATLATGLPPSQHGLVSHLVWLEDVGLVVNTLKWVDLTGRPVDYDYSGMLPRPNLWERLRARGIEPITVQPAQFAGSPLSRLLYRGARFEGTWGEHELVEATVDLAREPGRLIFTYVWQVDFAGHVSGLGSTELSEAIRLASWIWESLVARLPPHATLIGTADHGLIEYPEAAKILVRQPEFASLRYAGDPRGIHLWGDRSLFPDLASLTGGALADPLDLLGADPTETTRRRVGDSLLLAPEGRVILPPGFDKRLRAYHGGLAAAEREIPLLIG